MQCLLEKPPRLTGISGVTNRYEDFVAVHMNQTLFIHATGSFVSWHRYYVWSYEEVRLSQRRIRRHPSAGR